VNALGDLTDSFAGWAAILAGRPEGAALFRTTPAAMTSAVVTLAVAVLLSFAVQSVSAGAPSAGQVLYGLVVQGLTVGLLAFAIVRTLRFLHSELAPAGLLVPILYALAYTFVLAIPLALIGPNAALLAMIVLGAMLFRAGQVLAGMKTGTALGFAGLCVIVLVVVPNALYMLAFLFPSA
jgi:hypothetical protein